MSVVRWQACSGVEVHAGLLRAVQIKWPELLHALHAPHVSHAAHAGDAAQVKTCLAAGALPDEVDVEGRTALHFASGYGELECMRALIEAKAKLDAVRALDLV